MAKAKTPKQLETKIKSLKKQVTTLERQKKKAEAAAKKKATKKKATKKKTTKRATKKKTTRRKTTRKRKR